MKKKLTQTRSRPPRRLHGVVKSQPDVDVEALKACCIAIESCSCREMIKATLDFLNSKYGPPGVA